MGDDVSVKNAPSVAYPLKIRVYAQPTIKNEIANTKCVCVLAIDYDSEKIAKSQTMN